MLNQFFSIIIHPSLCFCISYSAFPIQPSLSFLILSIYLSVCLSVHQHSHSPICPSGFQSSVYLFDHLYTSILHFLVSLGFILETSMEISTITTLENLLFMLKNRLRTLETVVWKSCLILASELLIECCSLSSCGWVCGLKIY